MLMVSMHSDATLGKSYLITANTLSCEELLSGIAFYLGYGRLIGLGLLSETSQMQEKCRSKIVMV